MRNFRNTIKKIKIGRAVTFILKAEKSENTILFFFSKQKKKFLYILLYIEYSRIFFVFFFNFFFKAACSQSHNGGKISQGEAVVVRWM
jgi:hypothetical protein